MNDMSVQPSNRRFKLAAGSLTNALLSHMHLAPTRAGNPDETQSVDEQSKGHAFEDELFFTLRHQRNSWAKVAVGSIIAALMSLSCLIAILPLKETEAFVVMVDKTTGEAEKLVQVRPASLDQQDAVRQAELVSYVVDRETYDPADNPVRIPDVLRRSTGDAAETLKQLWTSGSPQYPPTVYGQDVHVRVVVKSISFSPATTSGAPELARVRLTKIREQTGQETADRTFVATVGFLFQPKERAKLEDVWKNPLGFNVLTYRIDAETAQ